MALVAQRCVARLSLLCVCRARVSRALCSGHLARLGRRANCESQPAIGAVSRLATPTLYANRRAGCRSAAARSVTLSARRAPPVAGGAQLAPRSLADHWRAPDGLSSPQARGARNRARNRARAREPSRAEQTLADTRKATLDAEQKDPSSERRLICARVNHTRRLDDSTQPKTALKGFCCHLCLSWSLILLAIN